MKKYFTKFLDLIKSHKKISVAVLLVLVFCLVGGIWFAQTGSRNKVTLADKASAEKANISVKSDSKEDEKVDSSEDWKDPTTEDSEEKTEQEATESTPAPIESSTTPAETSKTSVKSSSNSSAKTSSGQKGSAQKPSTSKASSASTQNTHPSSLAVKPTQPKQNTQTAQPAQPSQPSGHYETRQVLVSAAYDEPIYETQAVGSKCNTCGQVFPTSDAWDEHAQDMAFNHNDYTHGSYTVVFDQVQVGTKHHDAVYKTQQVWVQN
ncbi:hypothetical protein ACTQ1O_05960 [Bilifractor sp. LCP21S3_A7]|uniref:hypothetical protein n=1 Tax=Bilifractor sp. LCP21S3_A7 TaxID=3438738 RepID=UPI003F8FE7C6